MAQRTGEKSAGRGRGRATKGERDGAKGERAARILLAADTLFAERGFDGVSMANVADAAGVNKALVFYYYGSKDALFERVLDRYYSAHVTALEEAFEEGSRLPSRLHHLIDSYLDFIEANRHYPRLVQREVASGSNRVALIRKNLAPLLRWTERALADLAPASGPTAARHLFVTVSGAVINYFTYAPVLALAWDGDPLAPAALAERRAHLHWLVDAMLSHLATTTP